MSDALRQGKVEPGSQLEMSFFTASGAKLEAEEATLPDLQRPNLEWSTPDESQSSSDSRWHLDNLSGQEGGLAPAPD